MFNFRRLLHWPRSMIQSYLNSSLVMTPKADSLPSTSPCFCSVAAYPASALLAGQTSVPFPPSVVLPSPNTRLASQSKIPSVFLHQNTVQGGHRAIGAKRPGLRLFRIPPIQERIEVLGAWIQKMDVDGDGGRIDLRMKDKPHQPRRFSIRWSRSSNVMPRDGFASNSSSRRRASAIPSSSACRTDGSDPSRCAARAARSVSGKSSASFLTSAMVAIGASLVSTASKARSHHKTAT
jgi:hypothetical protein